MSMVLHASPPELHPTGWRDIAAAVLLVAVVILAIVTIGP